MNPTEARIAGAVSRAIGNQNETVPAVAKAIGFTKWKLNRKLAGKARKGFTVNDLHRICCYIEVRLSELLRSVL
jgi:hypothetical protein